MPDPTCQQAYIALTAQPSNFLKTYVTSTKGVAASEHSVSYQMGYAYGRGPGSGQPLKFELAPTGQGVFDPAQAPFGFLAQCVAPTPYTGNVLKGFLVDPNVMMVTTQLNACCFCWLRVSATAVLCAHVQPTGGMSGPELESQLKFNGRFEGFPGDPISCFGQQQYKISASVIGVPSPGTIAFAQVSDASGIKEVVPLPR